MNKFLLTTIISGFILNGVHAQNVGIGEASPSKKLEIKSLSGGDGLLLNTPNPAIFFIDNTDAGRAWSIYNQGLDDGLSFRSSDDDFTTNMNTRLFLEHSSGNVGIGTVAPQEKLQITDGAFYIGTSSVNQFESGRVRFSEYDGTSFQGAFIHYDGSANVFNIGVNNVNATNTADDVNAISIDRTTGNVSLLNGTSVNEFSTDGTLGGNSNIALPTEQAVKTYVDNQVGGVTESDPSWSGAANTTASIGRTGNVGIGVSIPSKKLHIDGGAMFGDVYTVPAGSIFPNITQAQLLLAGGHNAGYNLGSDVVKLLISGYDNDGSVIYPIYSEDENGLVDFWIKNRPSAASSPTMFFEGDFGIGEETPSFKLDVNGTGRFAGQVSVPTTPTANQHAASKQYVDDQVGAVTETDPTWSGAANTTGDIGRAGSLSLGTNTPLELMHVYGGEILINNIGATPAGIVFAEGATNDRNFAINYNGAGGGGDNKLQFETNLGINDVVMTLMASGNVGIGNTSPDRDLVIGNATATTDKLTKIISREDAGLEIIADNDNSGEDDNAYIYIAQDGALVDAILGFTGADDIDSRGGTYTDAIDNAMLFGTLQNHHLQLGSNGTAQLTIEPAGNIGIGNVAPTAKLDVTGTGKFSGQVTIPLTPLADTDAASKKYVDDEIISGVSGADDWDESGSNIYNNNTGNVGVGTSAPSSQFHVNGTTGGDGTWTEGILISNTNATAGEPTLAFQNSQVAPNYWFTGLNQNSRYDIAYGASFTDGNIKMTILNSGNMGVGTASPSSKLDVAGTGNFTGQVTIPITPLADTDAASKKYVDDQVGAVTETDPTWSGAANTSGAVGRTGNVGVGTTSPLTKIDVRGDALFGNSFSPTSTEAENIVNILSGSNASGQSNGIAFYETTNGFGMKMGYDGTGSGAANALRFYNDSDNPILTIENGGEVGIGVTAPSYALHVSGRIRSNGINETSDIRYKKNVETLENSLEKVMQLRGVSYDWRQDEFPEMKFQDGKDLGVIAQEIEKIIPEVVSVDNEGYKSVQYSHLVPVLIEAIKEQQEIISNQESVICQNTSEISNQQDEIELLKAKVSEMDVLKAEISSIKQQIQMQSKK